jgi:hypothetical protein
MWRSAFVREEVASMNAIRGFLAAIPFAVSGSLPVDSITGITGRFAKSSPKLALCQVGGWFGGIRVTKF